MVTRAGAFSIKNTLGCIALTVSNTSKNLFRVYSTQRVPDIRKVIFQKLHTIVIWEDGEKTVVKCSEEEFDKEKGLAMAIAKRLMDRNKFKRLIKEADIQDK